METLIFAQTQLKSDISSWCVCGLKYASISVLSSPWNSLEDFLTGPASQLPPCMGNEKARQSLCGTGCAGEARLEKLQGQAAWGRGSDGLGAGSTTSPPPYNPPADRADGHKQQSTCQGPASERQSPGPQRNQTLVKGAF